MVVYAGPVVCVTLANKQRTHITVALPPRRPEGLYLHSQYDVAWVRETTFLEPTQKLATHQVCIRDKEISYHGIHRVARAATSN